jgi:hypothetical protein
MTEPAPHVIGLRRLCPSGKIDEALDIAEEAYGLLRRAGSSGQAGTMYRYVYEAMGLL